MQAESASSQRFSLKRLSRWLLLAGFVSVIFGAKLHLLSVAGSDLPTWDQWDSQSEIVFRPWLEGRLTAAAIFQPHNEHEIATSKLYTLALLALNGQWDSLVETIANAAIHTGFAVALLLLARRWLQGSWLGAFGGLLVLLFTSPFSWENTLVGFQVQFYFLLWFALLHIWLTLRCDRFKLSWGLGQLCGLLGLLSMGSGFFSSLAIVAVLGLRLVQERRWTIQQATSVAIALVFATTGAVIKPHVPGHDVLMAHSIGELISMTLRMLAWPGSAVFPWSLLLLIPAVVFTIRCFSTRPLRNGDAILLALLAWVFLQILATAYARGGTGILASRYMDLFAVNAALGFISVHRVFSEKRRTVVAFVWLIATAAGAIAEGHQQWRQSIVAVVLQKRHCEEHVRAYLHTDDPSHLLGKPFQDIPYPSGELLIQRLASPAIRGIMPPSVRTPARVLVPEPQSVALPNTMPPSPAPGPWLSTYSGTTPEAPFTWRSPNQPATTLPVLRFRIAGDLGRPGKALRLVVKSEHGESVVTSDAAPGSRWKTVNVFRPAGEWWLEVTDTDPGAWFAFTAPVEMGRLTWLGQKIIKHHTLFFDAGLIFFAAAAGLMATDRRRANWRPLGGREFSPYPDTKTGPPKNLARIRAVCIALLLLKVGLVAAQPIVAIGGAIFDDRLFLILADHILKGEWLGPYSQMTLAKGPMYSLWIAGTALAHVPLPLANHFLYFVGCLLLVRAVRPLLHSELAAWGLLLLLWWNPMTYEMPVLGRILRQNLYTPATLLFFAALVALETRRHSRPFIRTGWGALLGASGAVLWLTREETIWAAPSAALLMIAAAWLSWRAGEKFRPLLGPLATAAITGGSILAAVCTLNLAHYNWFGTVEFRAPQFVAAYGALQRVKSSYNVPYVPVTREAREKLYPLSPAFAELKPFLEGPVGDGWANICAAFTGRPVSEREIAGGWFMWALRDAVAAAGHAHNARESLDFYGRIAREVNAACDAQQVPASKRRDTLVPPWQSAFGVALVRELPRSFAFLVRFQDFSAVPSPSAGDADLLQLFRVLTHWRLAPSSEAPGIKEAEALTWRQPRICVLDAVGRVLGLLNAGFAAVAFALWLAGLLWFWRRRQLSYSYVVATAALASVTAVVVINTLVHVMSFPNRSPGAFAQAYPLLLLFEALVCFEAWTLWCEGWQPDRPETG